MQAAEAAVRSFVLTAPAVSPRVVRLSSVLGVQMLTRRLRRLAAAPVAAWVAPWLLLLPSAAQQLQGGGVFLNPPWRVELISYDSTTWDPQPDYYFTVEVPADAGAPLGGLTIQQSRGSDWSFPYYVDRTSAFVGRPRAEGRKVPLTVDFHQQQRRFEIRFDPPVPPGTTVTTVLKPWNNPDQADTYMFEVKAWPAGPNPTPSPLGYATLRIYNRFF